MSTIAVGGVRSLYMGNTRQRGYSTIPEPLVRTYQPLYDRQQIDANLQKIEFFQNPVELSWKRKVQIRRPDGRFGRKSYIHYPQKRNFADTNMERKGYLTKHYEITGIGLMTDTATKKQNVQQYAEASFLIFKIGNKEYLRLPTTMLLAQDGPAFNFPNSLSLIPREHFIVYIESPQEIKISSPFKIRCVLSGYFN